MILGFFFSSLKTEAKQMSRVCVSIKLSFGNKWKKKKGKFKRKAQKEKNSALILRTKERQSFMKSDLTGANFLSLNDFSVRISHTEFSCSQCYRVKCVHAVRKEIISNTTTTMKKQPKSFIFKCRVLV